MQDSLIYLTDDIGSLIDARKLTQLASTGEVSQHGIELSNFLARCYAEEEQLETSITLWIEGIIRFQSGAVANT